MSSCRTLLRDHHERHLDWDGCFNVRDLGGPPAGGGMVTRWGAVVRADALNGLTDEGWRAVLDHGVRTVIDLRNDDELGKDAAVRPPQITTVHVPLDAMEDRAFWNEWQAGPQFGTPLYYLPHLERFPERSAAVIAAVAEAEPGGVVVHCGSGRDRAGQVTILLLSLARVPAEIIAEDYVLSHERVTARYAARGESDQGPPLLAFLHEQGTTAEAIIAELLATLDIAAHLRAAGLTEDQLVKVRRRLVGVQR